MVDTVSELKDLIDAKIAEISHESTEYRIAAIDRMARIRLDAASALEEIRQEILEMRKERILQARYDLQRV